MNKIIFYILCLVPILINPFSLKGQADVDCDCVYPIIFVHGWAGGEKSWEEMANELTSIWGDEIIIPDMAGPNPKGTVYYANLNFQYGQTKLEGANGVLDTGAYVDDDVVVHEQFANAPELLPGKCVYAISFKVKKDPIFLQPLLITETHNLWTAESSKTPDGESGSNEASALKQGYALGKMIKKILEITGKEKVILVAHSMGGLACREYLQRSFDGGNTHAWWVDKYSLDGHKLAKLFTVGTPHRGSNTGALEGAPLLDEIVASILKFDLRSEAVRDLRYEYTAGGLAHSGIPGIYLYGDSRYSEVQIPTALEYYNKDVSCDGDPPYEFVEGINESFSIPWEGTSFNPSMALPDNIKYTYYVSDITSPPAGFPSHSDGIVLAERQWLYENGGGSTIDFEDKRSIPAPIKNFPNDSQEDHYILADRITTEELFFHTKDLATYTTLTIGSYETGDTNNVARGLDEGDYPYFAGKVEPGKWYASIAQKRADIVPADSEYTNNGNNLIDSDWYRLEVNEPLNYIQIEVQKPSNQHISRIDFYSEMPGEFSNEDSPISETSNLTGNLNFKLKYQTCYLQPGTYYFRISTALTALSDPEIAWKTPYKFKVLSGPVLYADGNCPEAVDCDYTFASYGTGSESCGTADYDCENIYEGEYGNLRIPVHVLYAGPQVESTTTDVNADLQNINSFLQISAGLPWEFYISSEDRSYLSDFNDFGSHPWYENQNIRQVFRSDSVEHSMEIRLIIVDTYKYEGAAGYPLGTPIPEVEGSNYIIMPERNINNGVWSVLAHELVHLFGLFHTFECDAFPSYNLCNYDCREGDGIADTPFDDGPSPPGETGFANLMDYDERFHKSNLTPAVELTPCQVAKMSRILFSCRNNFCLPLERPDIRFTNGLSVGNMYNIYGEKLDTIYAILLGPNRSNDANFAHWTFRKPNGTSFYIWSDSIDLDTMYQAGKIDLPGLYTVEVRDKRIYNESCESEPVIFTLELEACNSNGVCDPWETISNCEDCIFNNGDGLYLSNLEYFIDTDPGFGLGIPVDSISGGADFQTNVNVNLSELDPGVHTLYLRARNENGQWGFTQRRLFYLLAGALPPMPDLAYLEYFIDDDPGRGLATELPLLDVQNAQGDYLIDLQAIEPGVHTLYVRAQNELGQWSFVQRKLFYLLDAPPGQREVVKLEYFIDEDPGEGQATEVNITPGTTVVTDFSISTLGLDGNHRIYVRAKDNQGQWSFIVSDTLAWSGNEITLRHPNGGEQFTGGTSTIDINWDILNNVDFVNIELITTGGDPVYNIAAVVDPQGPYADWTVPVSIPSGYYRIKVYDATEPSVYDVSDAPFLIGSPCDPPEGLSTTEVTEQSATLNWNAVADAETYELAWRTVEGSAWSTIPVSTPPFTLNALQANTAYEWRVRATCNGENSGWTIVQSFITDLLPPACTLLSNPLNGSVDVNPDTDFSWTAVGNASGYFLTVGTTPGGANLLNNANVGNLSTYDPGTLPAGVTIYVTITPYNAGGNATNCIEESFTILPADDCPSDPLTLDDNPILSDTYQTSSTITSAGTVESGATVVFKAGVSVILQPGFHAQSGSSFHTRIESCLPPAQLILLQPSEKESGLLLRDDIMLTAYPNPFRDETVIEYRLIEEAEVELHLFSMTGARKRILQPPQILPRGLHRLILNGAELEPGMWFLHLRADREIVTRRVILMR